MHVKNVVALKSNLSSGYLTYVEQWTTWRKLFCDFCDSYTVQQEVLCCRKFPLSSDFTLLSVFIFLLPCTCFILQFAPFVILGLPPQLWSGRCPCARAETSWSRGECWRRSLKKVSRRPRVLDNKAARGRRAASHAALNSKVFSNSLPH